MSFTQLSFLFLFIPITFLLYNLCRKRWYLQNAVLLAASLYFYFCYGWGHVAILLACILLTYLGGLIGHAVGKKSSKGAKAIYISTAVVNLLILVFFKYATFTVSNLNILLDNFKLGLPLPEILLPVGLSFFIFQSSSYLFDLSKGKVKCEKNILNYAVFVSFFPTIVSGPIQKSRDFLPKLRVERKIKYSDFQRAFLIFLWGVFIKMVIADRLALFTNTVFDKYSEHSGITLLLAAIVYSFQIYADFSGYSYMAISLGILFGFEMQDNFKQPYFGTTIVDFWRRWHISLTSWFREYLYFPLGGNRKGTFRKYLNVAIVFVVSGLWHGASWAFVVWGAIHAIYQIVGIITMPYREKLCEKLKINRSTPVYRVWQSLCVFALATFAWIFFRSASIGDAFEFIRLTVSEFNPWVIFDGSLYTLGLSQNEWIISILALELLFVVSFMRERGANAMSIVSQKLPIRWLVYLYLMISIIVFGMYGPGYSANAFIYAGF